MRLALHLANQTFDGGPGALGSTLAETAKVADEGGFHTITVMDHWFQIPPVGPAEDPMLEAYSTLTYLAAHTERVKLGTLVTGVTYRHPALLAKTVTTLDVLSGGRAFFGIGAAWFEREHDGLGVPFPPISERFERLEEAIQITLQMWSDDDGPYAGTHYSLAETMCSPQPIQQPRPPIMIGGGGEKKTLKLVARYADACNLFDLGRDEVAHKLDVLERHCDAEGRDPAEIERTVIVRDPLADDFLDKVEMYAGMGVGTIWVSSPSPDPVAWTAEVAERVIPRLTEM